MNIRSAERLLLVAIVTSAVVAQVRVHTLSSAKANASMQTRTAQPRPTREVPRCDEARGVMLRAACETRRDRRPVDGYDREIERTRHSRMNDGWV
ncbi:hypothetical protein SAMN05192539_1006203 [Paraburkholderia diazotrophica]|uniref:Uncharacterized protein n=1 Tax=Paraburkholderia diazotrophica TaxID=667676 RepID=A0A1H6VTW8_9BURK|nr:hypothetical protein SAMN05192539_1006203 [Paraburkholderia diazotrophica]